MRASCWSAALLLLPATVALDCPTKPEDPRSHMTPDPQCERTALQLLRAPSSAHCHGAPGAAPLLTLLLAAAGRLAFEQVNGKIVTDIGKSAVNEEMQNCGCDNAFRYESTPRPALLSL